MWKILLWKLLWDMQQAWSHLRKCFLCSATQTFVAKVFWQWGLDVAWPNKAEHHHMMLVLVGMQNPNITGPWRLPPWFQGKSRWSAMYGRIKIFSNNPWKGWLINDYMRLMSRTSWTSQEIWDAGSMDQGRCQEEMNVRASLRESVVYTQEAVVESGCSNIFKFTSHQDVPGIQMWSYRL